MRRFGEGLYDNGNAATATLEAGEFDADVMEYESERADHLDALAEAAATLAHRPAAPIAPISIDAPAPIPVPGPTGEVGRLTIDQFDLATHDAIITIHNRATGHHRTFKVETLRGDWNPGKRVISILDGPDNTANYTRFGWVIGGGIQLWARYNPKAGAAPNVWAKYSRMVEQPARFTGRGIDYLIAGKCKKCGRRLTTARSITAGYGAECERMLGL
jgi:hypothetical protein